MQKLATHLDQNRTVSKPQIALRRGRKAQKIIMSCIIIHDLSKPQTANRQTRIQTALEYQIPQRRNSQKTTTN